jgi:hypothetical protein
VAVETIARIPAPEGMFDYIQGLLWASGELGRSVCRRGWREPDVWALAPAGTPAERALLTISGGLVRSSANAWMDRWLMAQGKLAHNFCLVAQDLLALPMHPESNDAAGKKSPGAWDVRGEESYLVVAKDELGEGVMDATAGWMISDEFILYVIEDSWPFDRSRPLRDVADKVRHVLVAVSEGESYGVISGA